MTASEPMREFTTYAIWRIATLITCILLLCCDSGQSAREESEFIGAMNRGKAYLENADSSLAIKAFEQAANLAPNSAPALRNLARAHLMARDMASLAKALERVQALEPQSAATLYLSGLQHARLVEFEKASHYFEEAVLGLEGVVETTPLVRSIK